MRIIPIIIAGCIVLTVHCPTVRAAEKDGYAYTIIDNEATITGFSGEPAYLEIPEIIDGCRVTEIRDNSFYNCKSLRHIDIPDSVRKIGHHAFYACVSLENVIVPESVAEIGMGTFCGCDSLKSVVLPDSLTELPDSCFRSCTSLGSVDIPQNIANIGEFCFSGCTSLSRVGMCGGVTEISDCAFYMCSSLQSLYIPESAGKIGVCAVGYIPTNEGSMPIEDFVILGAKRSEAERYANANHITFENAADSVHAFAIQRISGQKIAVPSVFLVLAALIFAAAVIGTMGRRSSENRRDQFLKRN